jgi:uncharacterized protein YjbI with pentapeptide repeats
VLLVLFTCFTIASTFSPDRKDYVGSHLLAAVGVRTALNAPFAEFGIKPSGWTGLADRTLTEIHLVKGASLAGRKFRCAWAWAGCFINANLEDCDLSHAYLHGSDFRGAHLRKVKAQFTRFDHSVFSQTLTDLNGVQYSTFAPAVVRCDFEGADFRHCAIAGWAPDRTTFQSANFSYAKAAQSLWSNCAFGEVSFQNADFRNAGFSVEKDWHDFRGADFTEANFSGAVFGPCRFGRNLFTGAQFADTDFSQCDGVDPVALAKAAILKGAKLPASLNALKQRSIAGP